MMRLKELRRMKNMSQSQVAGAVGISLRAYQNYEYALREPNIETINKLNGASEFDKKFIKAYLDIPAPQRENIAKFIRKI